MPPAPELVSTRAPSREELFLRAKFSLYYEKHAPAPSETPRREFGFGVSKKIDYRHRAFASPDALRAFLVREAPLFVSYSVARYEFPAVRPISKKNALGFDLVFDLDRPYEGEHAGAHRPFLCRACLLRSRDDAVRLCEDFLFRDFGFSKADTLVNYSGSKGFHVHVQGDAVSQLGRDARRQLVEYVTGERVNAAAVLKREWVSAKSVVVRGPAEGAAGWPGFVHRFACDALANATPESLQALGVGRALAKKAVEQKDFVLSRLRAGNWDALKGLGALWAPLVERAVASRRVVVDKQVTLDDSRLIRLEGSLHGDTGLVAKPVPWPHAGRFDALADALAFSLERTARVVPLEAVEFELGERTVAVAAGRAADVPEAAAVALLCKKKARLAEGGAEGS